MDHSELLKEIRTDLKKVEKTIVEKLDDYQKRVTKLETNEAWLKKIVIGLVVTTAGIGGYAVKVILTKSL